jgi:hypothetical protein
MPRKRHTFMTGVELHDRVKRYCLAHRYPMRAWVEAVCSAALDAGVGLPGVTPTKTKPTRKKTKTRTKAKARKRAPAKRKPRGPGVTAAPPPPPEPSVTPVLQDRSRLAPVPRRRLPEIDETVDEIPAYARPPFWRSR